MAQATARARRATRAHKDLWFIQPIGGGRHVLGTRLFGRIDQYLAAFSSVMAPAAFGEVYRSTARSALEGRRPTTSRPASTSFLITLRKSTYNPDILNVWSILHTVFGNTRKVTALEGLKPKCLTQVIMHRSAKNDEGQRRKHIQHNCNPRQHRGTTYHYRIFQDTTADGAKQVNAESLRNAF